MRWARLFDERVETMPTVWLRQLEKERLAEQVARIRDCAPFHAARLERFGDIADLTELTGVPSTTADEVARAQRASPPYGDLACADPVEIVRVCSVSGPGGVPLVTAYTDRDIRGAAQVGARSLWASGLRPSDVVLDVLLTAGAGPIETAGAAALSGSDLDDRKLLDLWPRLAPTVLLASAERALALAGEARRRGESPHALALSKLLIARRQGNDPRAELEDVWGARVSFVWGEPAVCDLLAAECDRRSGLHVLGSGTVLLELVDPETGAEVGPGDGGEGEVVLTHLERDATPLLRLRTGFIAVAVPEQCPCGRTGLRVRPVADRP